MKYITPLTVIATLLIIGGIVYFFTSNCNLCGLTGIVMMIAGVGLLITHALLNDKFANHRRTQNKIEAVILAVVTSVVLFLKYS